MAGTMAELRTSEAISFQMAKPVCITSNSVHKRSHAIWFKYKVKQEGMRSCNFAGSYLVKSVLLPFQVFRPVAETS